MTALTDFLACDTIMVVSFSGELHVQGNTQNLAYSNICITKKAGSLDIEFPIPNVAGLTVSASGSAKPAEDSAVWSVDEDVNVEYNGHKIDHVQGTIVIGIASQPTIAGTACQSGASRSFIVALSERAVQSSLTFSVPVFFTHVNVPIDQIAITGRAGS